MKLVIDIETNSLKKPTKIWLVVCKDVDTGELHVFRNLTEDVDACRRFLDLASRGDVFIGHNWLGYDYPVLHELIGFSIDGDIALKSIDTWIISKLIDYSRSQGHSVEAYGEEFSIPKNTYSNSKDFFSTYSKELEDYCIRDVLITLEIYKKYYKYISDPQWTPSIQLEHKFQLIVNDLEKNGFSFNKPKAERLLEKVKDDLMVLDQQMFKSFPPKEVLVREFTPKATKFGTISKSSVPKSLRDRILEYEIGNVYRQTKLVDFNPSSHKQIVEVLNEAGWAPADRTQTHIDTLRETNRLKYQRKSSRPVDIVELNARLTTLEKYGWKINEQNLSTLPDSAPSSARLLAKRILLESRRRTLTEWLGLVQDDGRIRGKFYGIGAWTHRMAHQKPNTANIPNEFRTDGSVTLLGKDMRSLWQAPRNRLLVGVDAEGIQLRIFAHYIDDPEFTDALVKGKKDDKTDPHSLNQRILGGVCKSRAAAKRFIYALLLGAGLGKLAEVLGCSKSETEEALSNLLARYSGFAKLKREVIPEDAKKGYFTGLDGRNVCIPGGTVGERKHLAMSGYLQNGEAVIMKKACLLWYDMIKQDKDLLNYFWMLVNFVHDEWQTEVKNNLELAIKVAKIQADSLRIVGEQLNLKCPLAGSYWNDDKKDFTIATNWSLTH